MLIFSLFSSPDMGECRLLKAGYLRKKKVYPFFYRADIRSKSEVEHINFKRLQVLQISLDFQLWQISQWPSCLTNQGDTIISMVECLERK